MQRTGDTELGDPRDRGEWRRPWTDAASSEVSDGQDDAEAVETRPIGTALPSSPQPPPPAWGDRDHGPGSPVGSVRPPDTIGTVEAPAASRRGRRGFAIGMLGALLGAVIGTAGTLAAVEFLGIAAGPRAPEAGPAVQAPVVEGGSGEPTVVTAVANAVTPSVVRIDVLDEQRRDGELVGVPAGVGSGVVYRSDGYLLTNNHVVENADRVRVRFSDGEAADAEVVGTDPLTDLAVLKVERTGLPAINLRIEPSVVVGETAIAIGSPFGLDASVTAGVVSALNRDLEVPPQNGRGALVIPTVIQTDAAINPGNSGGALVDAQGRLIGINTAILTASGGSQGVGFAIGVGSAVAAADQIIEQGFVSHAFLGVGGFDLTPEVARRYEQEYGIELDGGAVVERVIEGSAAEEAGLQPEDVIVAVDGEPIEDMSDLTVVIRRYRPGDSLTLTFVREDARIEAEVTLGERPR